MAMTDEERIIEALAKSRYEGCEDGERSWAATTNQARDIYRKFAAKHLAALRALGGDVTLLPAPEPTYTIRLTETEINHVINALSHSINCLKGVMSDNYNDRDRTIMDRLDAIEPDPELGA